MGEFGGHGYPVQATCGMPTDATGVTAVCQKTKKSTKSVTLYRWKNSTNLRGQGIAAGVYTQTTDVEGEINGLMTYDRKVIKIPAKELAELHRCLFEDRDTEGAKEE